MKQLEKELDALLAEGTVEHIAVRVGVGGRTVYDTFRGGVDEHTLFDMASVTKVMATTTLALIALDRGLLRLDDPVSKFFKTDKPITVKHLLTHTMGMGYKPLYESGVPDAQIADEILSLPDDIPVGSDVRYSCPGFILLGKIMEKVFGGRLNECFDDFVAKPLSMDETSFLPQGGMKFVNANPEASEIGRVNDYNCRHLGGVSGNAGLFSSLADTTKYVKLLLDKGAPLFSEATFDAAAQNYTAHMSESRGLGFLYVDGRYAQTGGLFADGAIGHCGHTGQSVFVDYRSGLYAIVLSDATVSTLRKYGEGRYEDVMDMRARVHAAIARDLAVL